MYQDNRMSACSVETLTRYHTTSGPNTIQQGQCNSTEELVQSVIVRHGNRCGHFPSIPRLLIPPKKHKKRFPILHRLKENLAEAYFYPLKYEIGELFYHDDKTNKSGRKRKVRSDAREPMTHRVGQAILHYVNIEMMALGFFNGKGRFINFGIDFLSKVTGVSYSQTRTTIKAFEKSGYLTIEENKYKTLNGEMRSGPSMIRISPKLFLSLGATEEEIDQYKNKKSKEHEKEVRRIKAKEYYDNQKSTKKNAKKELKNIRELLTKAKDGIQLNDDEKALLEKEYPGYERIAAPKTLYRDYTGISQDRDRFTQHTENPSQIASFWTRALSLKLKPPS